MLVASPSTFVVLCSADGTILGTSVPPLSSSDQRWHGALSWWAEEGTPTGSLTHDGHALNVRRVDDRDVRFVVQIWALDDAPSSKLTARQLEVAQFAVGGATAREIGLALNLSEHTVRRHLQDVYQRLEVASRLELARALEAGRAHTRTGSALEPVDNGRMGLMADRSDVATLERERDLYRSLLELSEADNDVSGLLHGILDIVRELTGADQLYLQAGADLEAAPAYWAAIGTSTIDVDVARAHLSRSIVREALVGGGVVETACALTDERFDGAESVKANRVGAVICAAVGGDPELGLLYVQGARGGAGLRRDAARIVGTTARVVASGVERQVLRAEEARRGDATEAIRARFAADEFVGHSPALIPVLELASLAAGSDAPVLLTGPSGTGKSLLARVIAKSGARRDAPFVEVNCAALPGALIESELFGASRGAHSTAMDARPGLVSSAEGGTLFFDEITELPMFAQAKLLHLTQTGTYYRLGDDAPRRANVRVIAATNADFDSPDAERQLRRDLYYRLAVVKINLPGLDERNDDVALLARELASRIAEQLGMRHAKIASDAISLLQRRRWPGHIRELRNVLELGLLRARAEGTNVVRAGHVENPTQTTRDETPSTLQERTRRFQRDVIESALSEAGGRTAVAAEILGLSRSHLYHLITTLSVNRAPNGRDD